MEYMYKMKMQLEKIIASDDMMIMNLIKCINILLILIYILNNVNYCV